MSEFHDPDLRQELGRLSGPYPDDNAAFAAWQRRIGQVRRRRVVAWATIAALSLVIGTVAVAARAEPGRNTIVPGKSADTSAAVIVSIASTEAEAEESSTVPEAIQPETSEATTLALETVPTVVDTVAPETEAPVAAGTASNGSSSKGNGGTPSTPAPEGSHLLTQTFTSVGGTITVRQDGDRLTVIAKNPAPGFSAKENNRSGRKVEVTFESEDHKSEITVKVSDGVMDPDVNESDDDDGENDHDSSVPHTTDDDHDGGDGRGDNGDENERRD